MKKKLEMYKLQDKNRENMISYRALMESLKKYLHLEDYLGELWVDKCLLNRT